VAEQRRKDVLVTDDGLGQGRAALAVVRALGCAGYRPIVAYSSPTALAPASRYCAGRVRVPAAGTPEYAEALRAELERNTYLTVLPTSDLALIALGCSHLRLLDKGVLADAARRVGIKVPPALIFDSPEQLLESAAKISFPAVVKPTGSHGSTTVKSGHDLGACLEWREPLLVQPYLTGQLRAVAGVVWRGRFVAAVHQRHLRTWRADPGGPACAAETVEPDMDLETKMLTLLDGYDGIFQAELRGEYLLDLNLRAFASLSLSVAAGANLPAIYCAVVSGETLGFVRARPGVSYRWLDGDVRSILWSVRNKRLGPLQAVSALAPRRGVAHGGPESLSDPAPMFARVRHGLRKVRHVAM
jgi:hypothetical protein